MTEPGGGGQIVDRAAGRDGRARFPASFAQKQVWLAAQLDPTGTAYNCVGVLTLHGPADMDALAAAFDEIVRRHAALRTTFALEDGELVQVVAREARAGLLLVDLGGGDPRAERRRRELAEAAHRFDLARGPLLRVVALRAGALEHHVIVTLHHIVTDRWSREVLLGELSTLYAAFARGAASPLAPLPAQYADLAAREREELRGPALRRRLDFWRAELAGAPPRTTLPRRPSRAGSARQAAFHTFALDAPLSAGIGRLSRSERVTPFMVLLGALSALLHRYTGAGDLVVGCPAANRTRGDDAGVIGLFVNTLPVRVRLSGDLAFRDLLRRVRASTLAALAHQDVPLHMIVEELRPPRDAASTPLFQVVLAFQGSPEPTPALPGLEATFAEILGGAAKYDLTLALTAAGEGFAGCVEYDTSSLDAASAEQLVSDLAALLRHVAADPGCRLLDVPLAPARAEAPPGGDAGERFCFEGWGEP